MYFVDNNTGVPVMPPVKEVLSSTPLFFTEGGNGVPPTWPGPDWFNIIQSELINFLAAYGLNPEKSNLNQLQAAVEEAIRQKATESSALLTAIAALVTSANKMPYFTGKDKVAMTDLTDFARTLLGRSDAAGVLTDLGLGNTKYGAPLIGQLIEWPLQKMPHEIWPDMGQEYIPYMAQSFDPVKYPLLSQLHPTNVLPADMRAYVARGWDNGRGVDTGRALMSAQSSGAPNLTGTVQNVVGILGAGSSGAALGWTPGGVSSTAKSGTDSGVISIVLDASISSKEYQAITEVRVKNVAWNMIVRAK
ncbi:TPA: hypothetical protein JAV82_001287 [Kluyvera ascorbata]|nr:hypothetical protein [Kluyvera ascorbata]